MLGVLLAQERYEDIPLICEHSFHGHRFLCVRISLDVHEDNQLSIRLLRIPLNASSVFMRSLFGP